MEKFIDERINRIFKSNKLDELPIKYLPPVSNDPELYYFISYSHKDYKQVYSDIFALQAEGINIWYDRAMPAGESWQDTAEKFIKPSRCAGVIFYISKNSLMSDAIHKEIELAKRYGKSCLTVNLPFDDDYIYNGKNIRGAEMSAAELADVLKSCGEVIKEDKYRFISEAFNSDVLYVRFSASAEFKAEKISNMKKPPLFKFEECYRGVRLTAVNDIEVSSIKASDFAVEEDEHGKARVISEIGKCAFANCKSLVSVQLPSTVVKIDKYAFFGCRMLERINIDKIMYLHENAFCGCESLKSVELNNKLIDLPDGVFSGCHDLEEIELPSSSEEKGSVALGLCTIGKRSFADCCKLKKIVIPQSVFNIEESAFENCSELKEIVIPDSVSFVGKNAFGQCDGLEAVYIGAGLTDLDITVFRSCNNLKSIEVGKDNKSLVSKGNCVIAKERGELILGCQRSIIPDDNSIVSIGERAFDGCVGLKEINIPQSVRSIKSGAFAHCTGLKKIVIPDGAESIEDGAFSGCFALTDVFIPTSIKSIGDTAFHGCGSSVAEAIYNNSLCSDIEDKIFTIHYRGTMAQWETFESVLLFRNAIVKCADGEI